MNQNRSASAADRTRARQTYLRKMAASFTAVGITSTGALLGLLLMIDMLQYLLVAPNYIPYGLFHKDIRALEIRMLLATLVLFLSPVLVFCSYSACRNRLAKAREIVYVPPVREQIAMLPADEVLLRSSDQPIDTLHGLLRAAHTKMDHSAEELLRSCDSSMEAKLQQQVGGSLE